MSFPIKNIFVIVILCSISLFTIQCSTTKITSDFSKLYPNGISKIYCINQNLLYNENQLCKAIADSFKVNKSAIQIRFNKNNLLSDMIEVKRQYTNASFLNVLDKECFDDINNLQPDLYIQMKPIYYTTSYPFGGKSQISTNVNNSSVTVDIYYFKNNKIKLLESFDIRNSTAYLNLFDVENEFAQKIYARLKALSYFKN